MQKLPVLFILLLIAGIILPGCRAQDSGDMDVDSISPSKTQVPEGGEMITATQTPTVPQSLTTTQTLTPDDGAEETLSIPEEEGSIYDLLNCGGAFCQAPWPGFLARPIGPKYRRTIDLSYPFASTKDDTLDPHHGVEFQNSSGTPVLAAEAGKVIFAGSDVLTLLGPYTGFYGNVIILQHPDLWQGEDVFTLYAHLSLIEVKEGAQVDLGEKIGEVGASGAADGSHLHFEIRLGVNAYDRTVNPVLWFAPIGPDGSDGAGSLAGVILDRQGIPIPKFDFVLERYGEDGTVEEHYYPRTYVIAKVNAHPDLGENFVLSDIPPGDYRLAFIYGRFYEVFFTLEPGALGWIRLQVD